MGRVARHAAAAIVLAVGAAPAYAYLYHHSGVTSNLLVFDNKVLFTQADGTLTLLDLGSGKVLRRGTERPAYGQFRLTKYGILAVTSCQGIHMLDKDSLAVLWQTPCGEQANTSEDFLVSSGDDGRIECRRLADGKLAWSMRLDRWVQIVLEGDKVLVTNVVSDAKPPVVCLLDLPTGRELLRKTVPVDCDAKRAYYDGQRIYLGVKSPSESRTDMIQVWDLGGALVDTIEVLRENDSLSGFYERFVARNLVFSETGRVLPAAQKEILFPPQWTPGLGPERPALPPDMEVKLDEHRSRDRVVTTIAVRTPTAAWQGLVPDLGPYGGSIDHWTFADGRILLGSNLGHVECLDTAGKSLWLYMFPTVRVTVSCSGRGGQAPRMAKAAAIHRQQNTRPDPPGLCIIPPGKAIEDVDLDALLANPSAIQHPPVTRDPSPVDLFTELPHYLRIAWALVLGPVLLWLLLTAVRLKVRRLELPVAVLVDLAAAAAITFALYEYGWVSGQATLTGKVAILLLGAIAVFHAVRMWRRGGVVYRVSGGLALASVLILGYFARPVIFWA